VARWMTIVATVFLVATAGSARAEEVREQSSRDWEARGLDRIQVDNPRGETSVLASRDGRVHLSALKILRHSERRGAQALSRATILEADTRPGTLEVRVRYSQQTIHLDLWDVMKGIELPEVEVRLVLEVPPELRVSLNSASGDLRSAGLSGRQDLKSASGDIDVSDATGSLHVDTRSGDATLDAIASAVIGTASGSVVITSARGSVAVNTSSGDVRIDSASDSVRIATESGEVRVGLARGGLDVQTASGDVVARGSGRVRIRTGSGEAKVALIAPLQLADLATSSGDVIVRLAPGIDCRVDADAGSGDVEVELPLEVRTMHGNHIVGRLGRGIAGIVIRSSSGSVNVAR
jgi:DUF4097 and DUF4098 domain-containing protein YvlB